MIKKIKKLFIRESQQEEQKSEKNNMITLSLTPGELFFLFDMADNCPPPTSHLSPTQKANAWGIYKSLYVKIVLLKNGLIH